ncbi:MAG: hypothetical protein ACOYME_13810 [Prochlorotrichaceae cyanobacterium]
MPHVSMNHATGFPDDSCRLEAEADLLKQLLNSCSSDDTVAHPPYIWDPQSLETEAYLQSLEQNWSDVPVPPFSTIASSIDRLWAKVETAATPQENTPVLRLKTRFPHLPEPCLAHILQQVKTIGLETLSLRDQLLQCVQDLFPSWDLEDLQVVARPYAYAMRSFSSETDPSADLVTVEWHYLSDLEQISLCLAAAKAALHDPEDDTIGLPA